MKCRKRRFHLLAWVLAFAMVWTVMPQMGGMKTVDAAETVYHITFDAGDGGIWMGFDIEYVSVTNLDVKAGDPIERHYMVEWDGHMFDGWMDADGNTYTDDEVEELIPTGDMYFTAIWTGPKLIEVDPNGGIARDSVPDHEIQYSEPFTIEYYDGYSFWMRDENVVRKGYIFNGWEVVSGTDVGTVFSYLGLRDRYHLEEDGKIKAVWREAGSQDDQTYTISFDPNGGSWMYVITDSVIYSVDARQSLGYWPNYVEKGSKQFLGWKQVNGSGAGTVHPNNQRIYPDEDMKLVAMWEGEDEPELEETVKEYVSIVFDKGYDDATLWDGPEEIFGSAIVSCERGKKIHKNWSLDAYRNGYTFLGWRAPDGKVYSMTEVCELIFNEPTTFTAEWKKEIRGWVEKNGNKYYIDGNGKRLTGIQKIDGKTYYFNSKGVLQTGWLTSGTKKYYFDPATGAMVIGLQEIEKKWYYFNSSGVMQTGVQEIDENYYYFTSSGVMHTGWLTSGTKKYYFDMHGAMVTGEQTIDGMRYYFNANGVLQEELGPEKCKITIDPNGGWVYLYNEPFVKEVYYGRSIGNQSYAIWYDGYKLVGWKVIGGADDGELLGENGIYEYVPSSDVTLQAVWESAFVKDKVNIVSYDSALSMTLEYVYQVYPELEDVVNYVNCGVLPDDFVPMRTKIASGEYDGYTILCACDLSNLGETENNNYFSSFENIGFTDADYAQSYAYLKEMGMVDGKLKAVAWECYPSGFTFNTDIAKKVLGTDDPDAVQEMLSTPAKFNAVAKKMKAAGYYMTSGLYHRKTNPGYYASDGEHGRALQELLKSYDAASYDNRAREWSSSWTSGMYDGTVFGYFVTPWFMGSMEYYIGGNDVSYKLCKGPVSFYWGASFLQLKDMGEMGDEARTIVKALVSDEVLMKFMVAEKNAFVNNKSVNRELINNGSLFGKQFAGQNAISVWHDSALTIGGEPRDIKTGWVEKDGKRYYYNASGVMVTGVQKIDGKTYYFSSKGVMKTGWLTSGDKKYYFGSDGAMVTGVQKIDGKTYYFTSKGVMKTGWLTSDDKKYYFGTDGAMVTGVQKINGKTYYFSSNGVMYKGWLTSKNRKYYFDTDGAMVTGTKVINGVTYVFAETGELISKGNN